MIVSGETGSGKTTQLPKICLSIGRGVGAGGTGLIGHTQPRRLAATATARRIADELGSPLGEHVGYKIRFHDRLQPGASIKLMTDGILLAETQGDPLLSAYDTIIIDEAHERSLNIDFLLGYLKRLLPRRPDLKLIVTSATIDADRFARHFGDDRPAPVIEVSGRLYPVEVRYRPVVQETDVPKKKDAPPPDDRTVVDAVIDAVDELARIGPGDVLVFFPGEREIRDAAAALRGHHPAHTEILPLFARLSAEEQERVFRPSNARRIVLATNVAETSLTVPGIRYVVDTGTARVKRYSYRNKVEQLRTEPVSRAAANQRAGRCGRVAAGVCIRLYDEADYASRPPFTDPEILRSSLAAVILRMKTLGLGDVDAFPFLEPPLPRAITDGYQLLTELGALDDAGELTTIGRELGRLPLDPRIGRMILAARDERCMAEVLVLAAALSIQDPRDRPADQREAADDAQRVFVDERSDFVLGPEAVGLVCEGSVRRGAASQEPAAAARPLPVALRLAAADARVARRPPAARDDRRRASLARGRGAGDRGPDPSRAARRPARQHRAAFGRRRGSRRALPRRARHPLLDLAGLRAREEERRGEGPLGDGRGTGRDAAALRATGRAASSPSGSRPSARISSRRRTASRTGRRSARPSSCSSAGRSTGCRCTSSDASTSRRSIRSRRARCSCARRWSRRCCIGTATRRRRTSRATRRRAGCSRTIGGRSRRSRSSNTRRDGPTSSSTPSCWSRSSTRACRPASRPAPRSRPGIATRRRPSRGSCISTATS